MQKKPAAGVERGDALVSGSERSRTSVQKVAKWRRSAVRPGGVAAHPKHKLWAGLIRVRRNKVAQIGGAHTQHRRESKQSNSPHPMATCRTTGMESCEPKATRQPGNTLVKAQTSTTGVRNTIPKAFGLAKWLGRPARSLETCCLADGSAPEGGKILPPRMER